jgi:hypothetical protein
MSELLDGGDRMRLPASQGQVGLDHYEVRRWPSWIGTSPWSCSPTRSPPSSARPSPGLGAVVVTAVGVLVVLSVPEIRRLLAALVHPPRADVAFRLGWSIWRRRHQARARRAHYQQRQRNE